MESLGESLARTQAEDDARLERYLERFRGEYTGEDCPECGRWRVILCHDGKRRCEKCHWCIEEERYDLEP